MQQTLSNLKNNTESDNLSFHQNLNQRFIDFLGEKFSGDTALITDSLNLPQSDERKASLINEFAASYLLRNLPAPQ
jgi:hypothetical protein